MESDLGQVQQWSDIRLIKFNLNKCEIMRTGKDQKRSAFECHTKRNKLQEPIRGRDPGGDIMPDVSLEDHIRKVVSEANYIMVNVLKLLSSILTWRY